MNKFWIVFLHTYLSRLKTKSFLITTAITVGLIILLGNVPSIIERFNTEETIGIIDHSGNYTSVLKKELNQDSYDFKLKPYTGTEEEAKKSVEDGDFKGLVILKEDEAGYPKGVYYEESLFESSSYVAIQEQLQGIKMSLATEKAGLSTKELDNIQKPILFEAESLDVNAKSNEELNVARGIVYIMLFLLYFTIIFYGNMIATEIATEKSSRVMEILVSSVSPVVHMWGKILGIALLGFTQIIAFIGAGAVVFLLKKTELTGGFFEKFGVQDISISIVIYAILFFLLGYFIYATLAAMLGSLVTRVEDVQLLITPMMFLIIAAFMLAMFGLANPTAPFITAFSYIPFFSPMIMFLRVGMLDIPIYQVILSMMLSIVATGILGYYAARVYKGGVLMYGASSSLKDLKKAFKLSKK